MTDKQDSSEAEEEEEEEVDDGDSDYAPDKNDLMDVSQDLKDDLDEPLDESLKQDTAEQGQYWRTTNTGNSIASHCAIRGHRLLCWRHSFSGRVTGHLRSKLPHER